MHRTRLIGWTTMLLIVALLVAACAPRPGGDGPLPSEESVALDLPAIVLDFDAAGVPSIGDIPLADLAGDLAPGMIDDIALPADVVQFMMDSNIQHIQISNSPDGLLLLVNGRAVPSLKWDGDELANTARAVDLFGAEIGPAVEALEELLPLITNLGVGVVARFPVPEGVAAIELDAGQPDSVRLAAMRTQESFLQTVNRPPMISVPIIYDAQGSWRVGDLTYAEWISLTGMPIFDSFRLRPEAIDSLIDQGITEFAVSTDVDGIHVSINGLDLPYIGWADGELNNALVLAEQAGVWDMLEGQNMDVDDIVAMVETVLPVVQATEIRIVAQFPEELASVN